MGWTDEYREIVEFYYWEPQHIGRAKGEKHFASADEMYEHINKLEVSLNHILNLFFSLYPVEKLQCFGIDSPLRMLGAAELEIFQRQQKNATQPDMFFMGDDRNVAIELKLASKSSLQQVRKYVEFNASVSSGIIPLTLIYLTPTNDTARIFREKYSSSLNIQSALEDKGFTNAPRLKFVTYTDLHNSLQSIIPSSDIEAKLIGGVVTYLQSRDNLAIPQLSRS